MTDSIDEEVSAITSVLKALEPLSPDARISVVDYVTKRLGISVSRAPDLSPLTVGPLRNTADPGISATPVHLKEFVKQKSPRSANEMAAIVAYYLAELAPPAERKKTVNADDIRTYFKIGEYPLPEVQFTLPNAKYAGYFDALGDGEYQLNAVGHNLVAHSLPRSKELVTKKNRQRKRGQVSRAGKNRSIK